MTPDGQITERYLEHLTARDVSLLQSLGWDSARDARSPLWDTPSLEDTLGSPRIAEAVLGPGIPGARADGVSPFLVFCAAVHRTQAELHTAAYVSDWLGPGRSAPVFDVAELRSFLVDPWRRLFLVELLSSYTHVSSGSFVVSTRRGLRRQRFSELDPVRLGSLLEVVSDAERPGILRRLGDLALFLTGLFPDYVFRHGFGEIDRTRLLRTLNGAQPARPLRHPPDTSRSSEPGGSSAVGLLESLGKRWYQSSIELLSPPIASDVKVVGEIADRFGEARRILHFVKERFLFGDPAAWFGVEGA